MASNYIIPILVLIIILNGFFSRKNIYDDFIDGCIDGLKILLKITPNIFALIMAVNIFVNSGILKLLNNDIIPMILLRPISGNASLMVLNNIYSKYGVDSYFGFLGSVIQGSTDTTIYVLALYFGSVGIKKTRYALIVGLFADIIGIMAAFIVSKMFF